MTSNQPSNPQAQNRGARRRLRKAYRRQDAIHTFYALVEKGLPKRAASRECGFSYHTMWRLRRAYHTRGFDGLVEGQRPGGPSTVSKLKPHLTPEVLGAIRQLAVETGSTSRALRQFAASPKCPPELAAFLRVRRSFPLSVRKVIGLRKIRAVIFIAGAVHRITPTLPDVIRKAA